MFHWNYSFLVETFCYWKLGVVPELINASREESKLSFRRFRWTADHKFADKRSVKWSRLDKLRSSLIKNVAHKPKILPAVILIFMFFMYYVKIWPCSSFCLQEKVFLFPLLSLTTDGNEKLRKKDVKVKKMGKS